MTVRLATQLSLLDPADLSDVRAGDELAVGTWSYSRRSALDQCPRQYYNEYYGASRRAAPEELAKESLHFLKGLKNRHLRAGEILHLAIRNHLMGSRRGVVRSVDQLLRWAGDIFRADRAYSHRYPDGGTSAESKYPATLLLEYHYRFPDADALCAEAEERLLVALREFATDECYRPFRAAASYGAIIEHPFKLQLPGVPCPVGGKIDLAYAGGGGATVVDWKLGADDGSGDESLQLAVYALWAVEHFGCSADDIRVCKAHLSSGDVTEFTVDDRVLAAARARIIQDAQLMATMHNYGQVGVARAFTPCLQPAICRHCKYREDCWEGKVPSNA